MQLFYLQYYLILAGTPLNSKVKTALLGVQCTGNPPNLRIIGGMENHKFQDCKFRGMALGQVFQYVKSF